jgi:hypothetical protein
MAMHGYTLEVEQAYEQALGLFQGDEAVSQLYPVLRGLASYYQYRADFVKTEQVGRELMRLAEAQEDSSMRIDGHLVLGAVLAFGRDLHGGIDHLDAAIALIESGGFTGRRFRQGNDPRVACYTTAAFIEWLLGRPDSALARAEQGLSTAHRLGHPYSLAYARFHLGFLHLWRREPASARDRAVGVLEVADEHDLPIWRAIGRCLLGAALTGLGRPDEGLAEIDAGIAMYQGLQTPPVFWPLLLFVRAGAFLAGNRPSEGIGRIDEAIGMMTAGGSLTMLPEFYVLKGRLLAALSDRDAGAACFVQALELGRELDARSPQLRAAMGLSRLATGDAEREAARDQLRSILATFTEGFETPDLVEARELAV